MRLTLPTVKPLIEALQLADLPVRRQFRVVGAYCLGHPGPMTSDSLTGRRAPPRRPASCGAGAVAATLLLA